MTQTELKCSQQVIKHALRMWKSYFRMNLEQPRRVELIDSNYFDEIMRKEITSKRYLYEINSCSGHTVAVTLLRNRGNFRAGEKIIFIKRCWVTRMKNNENEEIVPKLMTLLRSPQNEYFSTMLNQNNLILTCIGRRRLILSRKQ